MSNAFLEALSSQLSRRAHRQTRIDRQLAQCWRARQPRCAGPRLQRSFKSSAQLAVVKPYLLADIGEGITECQIIQWFVQPGARVAQFDKICEVQSDKAAVEITSRFDGIIKKLHYEADDMATVGKPLVDIDIQSDISPEDEALIVPEVTTPSDSSTASSPAEDLQPLKRKSLSASPEQTTDAAGASPSHASSGKHKSLATPAVRHMIKELNLNIEDIPGTGKDGRVLKEDVQRFAAGSQAGTSESAEAQLTDKDKEVTLSPVQRKMFETMTKSLAIPHFLYTDNIDFSSLSKVRRALNSHVISTATQTDGPALKLSALPFIFKAVSLAFSAFPSINAHLDAPANSDKPRLTQKASHDFGIAIDTPQGLVVPVIRNVQAHNITSLAAEIQRLSQLARANKLGANDFSGATFTISNIGSIGGTAVAPVIVAPQVAILGVGRARAVPAFDEKGGITRREECVFSWSADHRIVDGATIAKAAELVKGYLEGTERMLVRLR